MAMLGASHVPLISRGHIEGTYLWNMNKSIIVCSGKDKDKKKNVFLIAGGADLNAAVPYNQRSLAPGESLR